MPTTYAVMLKGDVRFPPALVSSIFRKHLNVPEVEARTLIRRGRGIVVRTALKEFADEVAKVLAENQIECVVAELAEDVREQPVKAPYVKLADGIFTFRDGNDVETCVVAEAVGIVSVAFLGEPNLIASGQVSHLMAVPSVETLEEADAAAIKANLQQKMKPRIVIEEREVRISNIYDYVNNNMKGKVKPYLDILTVDQSVWFRLNTREFQFSSGKGKIGGGMGFRLLMQKIMQSIGMNVLPPPTLKFIKEYDINDAVVMSMEEMNNFTLWLALNKPSNEQ